MAVPKCILTILFCLTSLYLSDAEVFESVNAGPESIIQGKATTCEEDNTLMTNYQRKLMKNLHNKYRRKPWAANMREMNWGGGLSRRAQALANTCEFKHGMLELCDGRRMGQNLYATWSSGDYPRLNYSKAMDAWFQEYKDYDLSTLECTPNKACGHYTQIVWAASSWVGCGYAKCPSMTMSNGDTVQNAIIIVCDYYKPGNYAGVAPFIRGRRCSQCPSGTTCVNNLCAKS